MSDRLAQIKAKRGAGGICHADFMDVDWLIDRVEKGQRVLADYLEMVVERDRALSEVDRLMAAVAEATKDIQYCSECNSATRLVALRPIGASGG